MNITYVFVACCLIGSVFATPPKERQVEVEGDDGGDEIIKAYPDDYTVVYTVFNKNGESQVVQDFTRKLRYVKPPGGKICIAMPMKHKEHFKDGDDFAKQETDPNRVLTTEKVELLVDDDAIPNPDFLNDEAKEVCEGLPVHWGHSAKSRFRGKPDFASKRGNAGCNALWNGSWGASCGFSFSW